MTSSSSVGGVVIRATARTAVVACDDGHERTCPVRAAVHHRRARSTTTLGRGAAVVVGDRVRVGVAEEETARVDAVEPRRTVLERKAGRSRQVIAANVDQVIVTVALADPPLRTGLVDRYLIAAHQHGIEPVICLNKADLAEPAAAESVQTLYRSIGYEAIVTSAKTGMGLPELEAVLHGGISVFAGPSGAGKSMLINRLLPDGDGLATGEVNPRTGKGRHTTTVARMLPVPGGGSLIDTPGIRRFTLWDVEPGVVHRYFPEFVERADGCRYPDCVHVHETDCAIKQAVDTGAIDPRRYRAYRSILEQSGEDGG